MNKSAIQKFAIWARNELMEQVKQRAYQYGIEEKYYGDANAVSVHGRILTNMEKEQRKNFILEIKKVGYARAIENVAYTWFNRLIALRYMEVRDYLPTHIRVFSNGSNQFNPDILREAMNLDLPNLDRDRVIRLLTENKSEELYRYLLITQCNALNNAMPEMFERMGDYAEILLPNNILSPDGVIGRMISDIPEEDFRDAVQIIGWLYQYYNTEPKEKVFSGLKKNVKITRENIPAATQLFTPDWIVKYMVENSLGRIYVRAMVSGANQTEKEKEIARSMGWRYYLPEAEQTETPVSASLSVSSPSSTFDITAVKVIDPCMGSGHILVYAFDVLMQIYRAQGYTDRDATISILSNNLFGLDIDRRAFQLAYFALMMKAREYNRRIFGDGTKPQVYHPAGDDDGMEFGSLLKIGEHTGKVKTDKAKMAIEIVDEKLQNPQFWNFKRLLSQKYDVVVTNPPYMGSSGMGPKLLKFVKDFYPDSKGDLYAVFIERCAEFLKTNGYYAMITMHSWMFVSSFEKLRANIVTKNIVNMAHLGTRAFEEIGGEVVQTTAFVINNKSTKGYKSSFIRLTDYADATLKEEKFLKSMNNTSNCNYHYTASVSNFSKIPGAPIAYWVSDNVRNVFEKGKKYPIKLVAGCKTADNDKYLRFTWEISNDNVGKNWSLYAKGGGFRKWYGNIEYVIDISTKALTYYDKNPSSCMVNEIYWYQMGITWNSIATRDFSCRLLEDNCLFDMAGPSIMVKDERLLLQLLGLMNTNLINSFLSISNESYNVKLADVEKMPLILSPEKESTICSLVRRNVELSKADWDSFETSWDFARHPLVKGDRVESAYAAWEQECEERFQELKANEEEINRIFIEIYGLQDEMTPDVIDRDVTVRRADLGRDIRSLISYAVGCMFGRYSLEKDGLVLAGGKFRDSYSPLDDRVFNPNAVNIVPICDDDYFKDDALFRLEEFVQVVYGKEHLKENMNFIADALYPDKSGTARERIRHYFINDFYKDHIKIYKKRPIYWMFDSGKKNSFKALMYLHRYEENLCAILRTDYVFEQQERYRAQLETLPESGASSSILDKSRITKQREKYIAQLNELTKYEEWVHNFADRGISINLDDGVKVNYEKFASILADI